MIREKTVLVLGAGASMPYGYPSGDALRKRLCDPSLYSELLLRKWLYEDEVALFCESFEQSGITSIDAFLARRGHALTSHGRTFGDIGKQAIAIALRECESIPTLFHSATADPSSIDRTDNWYQYLWNRICEGINQTNIEDLLSTRLSVVTFNYDLSLEQYLIRAAMQSYGVSLTEAQRLLGAVKIVHVYGHLSGNPFVNDWLGDYDFRFDKDWRLVEADKQGIQIIEEVRQDLGEKFKLAYDLLSTADRIGILGFSFDPSNFERLRMAHVLKNRARAAHVMNSTLKFPQFCATTIGMEHTEQMHYIVEPIDKVFSEDIAVLSNKYLSSITDSLSRYEGCKSTQLLRRSGLLVQ